MGRPVMVVEDDLDIQESIVELLSFLGYDAVTATNGQEALRLLRHIEPPSLIFLDLSMPGMDGATFRAKQLADPVLVNVPVVLISADTELREKARKLQVAAFVRKPLDADLLTLAIERCREARTAARRSGEETRPHR